MSPLDPIKFCWQCQHAGLKSKVHYEGSSGTALSRPRSYWDEEGRLHNHNSNKTKHTYHCSEGHVWNEEETFPCQTCGQ
jgi:hypothetical protein